jgi:hypothetical protein
MTNTLMQQVVEGFPGLTLLAECKRYEPGVGFDCNAIDVGLDSYVRCLEEDSECPFSVPCTDYLFCKCPARVYFAKELEK